MIIGIGHKKQVGKDTVGQIIQIMLAYPDFTDEQVLLMLKEHDENLWRISEQPNYWDIVKFADALKDATCMFLGCTREQLEDEEFKNTLLGEEWDSYRLWDSYGSEPYLIPYTKDAVLKGYYDAELVQMTPRLFMELLGTDCGRQIIHPNIWVNALMSEYKPLVSTQGIIMNLGMSTFQLEKVGKEIPIEYPNWIITDVRFPNEADAILDRGGFLIKVNRPDAEVRNTKPEKALENYRSWKYEINNSLDFEYLIKEVRTILKTENLI